jgi:hypothetical protein
MTVAPLAAQYSLPLTSVEVKLEAYGISGPEEVRRGRLSVAYRADGLQMAVYYLRTDPVQPRITYPDPPPMPEPSTAPEVSTRETALWVWQTALLLRDTDERETFLDFIEHQGITRVFLYLASAEGEQASAGYIPFSSEELGPLLADLRARGARAYALDGDKDYVLQPNHAGVFRTVERLVEHNRSVPPEQRFYGVRYDIEPYLVEGFQGPRRQDLLNGYVELIAGVSRIAHAGDLAVAVDIPFWFDAPDEETGVYMEAELEGRRAPILEHIMSVVDDIAIMDYRTDAMGANGAITHSFGELAMGEEKSVDVFVGVETVLLPDEDLFTFYGPVSEGLPPHGDARWIVLEQGGDGRARLWIVDSEEALSELAARTTDSRFLRHWPAGRPTRVAADMQSFHNLGADRMQEVTDVIVRHLVGRPAFVGLAFHDYMGLKALLKRD